MPKSKKGRSAALNSIFDQILKVLKSISKEKNRFLLAFPSWLDQRLESIRTLEKLASDLNNRHFYCNVAKLVGSSVGILGGVQMLLGAGLIPFTAEISPVFLASGSLIGLAGGGINVGSVITESFLHTEALGIIKFRFEEDQKYMKYLIPWWKSSTELIEAIEKIWDFNIFTEVVDSMVNSSPIDKRLGSYHIEEMKKLMRRVISELGLEDSTASERTVSFNVLISTLILIKTSIKIVELHKTHFQKPLNFEASKMIVKIGWQLYTATDTTVKTANAVTGLFRARAGLSSGAVSKAVANGLFGAAFVASDVMTLVATSVDVHNGSRSDQATMILVAKDKLKEELSKIIRLSFLISETDSTADSRKPVV